MLEAIKSFLGTPKTKNLQQVTPNTENLLNKIIWGQFVNDLVIFFDGKQEEFIKQGYQKNAMVYSIVTKIADKASECELQVFKKSTKAKEYKNLKYSAKDLNIAQ